MIQKFVKMSRTAWIEKIENDLSVMNLAPKQFKREISEKEAILSVLNAIELDEPKKSVDVPENVAELLDYYRNSSDVDLLALILTFHDWYYCQNEDTQHDKHDKAVDWLIKNPEKFMRAWLDGYDSKKKPLGSNDEEYLTVDQYDYARKTGDWESGKTFKHRQDQLYISDQVQEKINDEILKEELEEHFTNLENIELIATESFKPLYESLVETMKKYFTIDGKIKIMEDTM
ncbi:MULTISPECIES: DUF1642 domain-containing protein [unclassified Enterococcus]|uniref:DUF1642 domain-containing protein n=1 Tax=unclassified Enterococcus TaxID=2608891 RepID=UPI0028FDA281|nr:MULTISPECIES: DUF1642 domain-containing protein [unclassified Enterococcus]MDU0320701.1 DUF1642 domain-containing protein [Enterococcus sp. 2STP]MDU0333896.1 DUF1642 domain-containing protein [Enterococcus sp. 2CBP]MDU0351125.1 DUF1642 domain-containing protein [Enterococcus sp. 3MOLP]